ncbi:unnamed protein product, partial [Discosporangium mesarthrocarpum]
MGTSGSKYLQAPLPNPISRRGSSFRGPFSEPEYQDLEQLYSSLSAQVGKDVDSERFQQHFILNTAPWFASRLELCFLKMAAEERGENTSLSFKDFFNGVASSCRRGRSAALAVLFDLCDESGRGLLGKAELGRLFEVSHAMALAAWGYGPCSPAAPFNSGKLADSVLRAQQKVSGGSAVIARSPGMQG